MTERRGLYGDRPNRTECNMKFAMTDTKVEVPTCKRIVVTSEQDTDSHPDETNTDAEREVFTAEDIEAFEAGDWCYLGIYAVATVYVPMGGGGASFIFEIPGPGLWHVESNSLPEYLQSIGDEQIGELHAVLDALGITYADAEIVRSL
jgi:hypothetical protein